MLREWSRGNDPRAWSASRCFVRDTDQTEAWTVAHWIDEYELDHESDLLAARLGTYWADARESDVEPYFNA